MKVNEEKAKELLELANRRKRSHSYFLTLNQEINQGPR